MKQKFSFHRLLHNNRLMLIVSLVAAVGIWATVSYGPSNVKERTMKIGVDLDLTDTYADSIGLCILDNTSYEVTVKVEGKWSVISALSSNDIRVRADYSELKKAGSQPVSFTASYNSEINDYDIVSVYPATIHVNCDYWETNLSFKVTPDLSRVSVTDPERYQLGDALIDPTVLPEGTVELEGPRSVTSRIKSVVARVEEEQKLSEVAVLPARLVALDENGAEVDISRCKLITPTSTTVNVTVPVWVSRTVDFTYQVAHMPALFRSAKEAVTLSHESVVVVGPEDELNELVPTLSNLGTFDFDNLLPENHTVVIPLNIPASCTVLDNVTEITATLDIASLYTRAFDITVSNKSKNVVFKNLPAGVTAQVPQQTLSDILLVGKNYTLRSIAEEDLVVTIDMSQAVAGAARYEARVSAKGKDTVWTYYGEDTHGISIHVNVQNK